MVRDLSQPSKNLSSKRKLSSTSSKEEILKVEILNEFKSLRQFSIELNIPYSTLVTALDGKIDSMAYGTVIKICERLNLNPIDFSPLSANSKTNRILSENNIAFYYKQLNKIGRKKAAEFLEDLASLSKYTE